MVRKYSFTDFLYLPLLLSFLALYLVLSVNDRLVADDFYFLKNFEDAGWWQSMLVSRQTWVTRWTSILWLNFVFFTYQSTGGFLLYLLITLFALAFALKRVWSTVLSHLQIRQEPGQLWKYVFIFLLSFFFLSLSPGETFFWITSTSMYLWSFTTLCFGVTELLKKKSNIISFILCLFCFSFAGGAAEAISIPAFIFLLALFILKIRNRQSLMLTLFSIFFMALSIYVSYSGEGRALRQSVLPNNTIWEALLLSLKSIVKIKILLLSEKIHWIIFFLMTWIGIGAKNNFSEFQKKISIRDLSKIIFLVTGIFILLIMPASYLLGETPPHRAWILVSFLVAGLLAVAGIYLGSMLTKRKMAGYLLPSGLAALIILVSWLVVSQWNITGTYARSLDNRAKQLENYQDKNEKEIVLENLPPSGMLITSEISTDTNDFRNRHLQKYYSLDMPVRTVK